MVPTDVDHGQSESRASSAKLRPESSFGTPVPPSSNQRPAPQASSHEEIFDDVELESSLDGVHVEGVETLSALDNMATMGLPSNIDVADSDNQPAPFPHLTLDDCEMVDASYGSVMGPTRGPFRKWMNTLHRRAEQRRNEFKGSGDLPLHLLEGDGMVAFGRRAHRGNSSSGSSFGFVAAVRSASISLASGSTIMQSRRNAARSRGYSSSLASVNGGRLSEDSGYSERDPTLDTAATERALQRRYVLEELIATEESYISDVRFLMNVYVTILASLPTLPMGLRSSINGNLTDIVALHEEILGDLHRAVPHSEYTQMELPTPVADLAGQGHRRMRSLDAVPENRDGMSWLDQVPGMVVDPQVAAEVAKIFGKKMNRFFIYEEYGAKYEMMIKDVASTHRTMPQWDTYQKGLEALASTLGSANSNVDNSRKSLTIGDLLVKPIQRVCKYPLLFAELLKYTPVIDCPYSHMEVENALMRLREATAEINRATNDARMRTTLEKTWILQDRLMFANQRIDAASRNRIRSFGHIQLCGALHVCWQTREGVSGQYMVCLLYSQMLCLASAGKADQIYTVHACLNLGNIKLEDVDNGRGLQCHTAPFSWKVVFECDNHLHEIIMTACSPKEELEWRARLSRAAQEGQEQRDPTLFSSLSLNIKSLGTVFGKPGTMARRISIHRATTVGPKSPLCQVILRNTTHFKDDSTGSSFASSSLPINRSQSLLTTNARIPVLAPPRGERARLEALLSDVWSRETLPFPGMTNRSRSENTVRASASSMIRKLSVASITSTFTKRSASLVSMTKISAPDTPDEPSSSTAMAEIPTSAVSGREHGSRATRGSRAVPGPEQRDEAKRKRTKHIINDEGSSSRSRSTSSFERTQMVGEEAHDVEAADWRRSCSDESDLQMVGVPALRTSSANSLPRLSRHSSLASSKKSRSSFSDKENLVRQARQGSSARRRSAGGAGRGTASGRSGKSSRHSGGRWGRVGVLKREGMVQGLRNFFR